jgi:hypothetical protein
LRERKLLEEQKHKEMGIIIGIISIFVVLPIAVASWESSILSSEQFLLTLRETELLNVEHAYAYYHIKSIEIYQNLTTDFLLTQYLNKENLTENYNIKYLPMLALAQVYIQKANELKNDESHNVTELYNQAKNITNQNKLTTICNRVAIISSSIAVILSIFIAYDFYYGKEREQKDENMIKRIEEFCKKNIVRICWSAIILGIIFFALGGITINFNYYVQGSILITVGLGIISIGIGFLAIQLSMKSDEKMKAISELNFVEKNAMIYTYIDDLEGLKSGPFQAFPSSTSDHKTVSNDILKKMIRDLDSALIVINYISEETRNKFLSAFIRFSKEIKDHVVAFKDDDIKDYLRIIGLVEKYQFDDKEKAIDNLKKLLEEKLSNKET